MSVSQVPMWSILLCGVLLTGVRLDTVNGIDPVSSSNLLSPSTLPGSAVADIRSRRTGPKSAWVEPVASVKTRRRRRNNNPAFYYGIREDMLNNSMSLRRREASSASALANVMGQTLLELREMREDIASFREEMRKMKGRMNQDTIEPMFSAEQVDDSVNEGAEDRVGGLPQSRLEVHASVRRTLDDEGT